MLGRCREIAPRKKFRFKNKLLTLDATVIDLCVTLFDWARFVRTKGAVKLHLLLDHDGYLPTFAYITEGRVHEINIARALSFPKGSIIVVDKGYYDFKLFSKWTEEGVWFVSRLKSNADYYVVEERPVPKTGNILADELIRFASQKAVKDCPHMLRRVVVWDPKKLEEIELITNHLSFGATTIAAIYKARWEIEAFFRALKQNLKVKTFVGTSANALRIQIWTALIAMLMLKYLKFKSRIKWTFSTLVALVRWNLFTYRNLWVWLDNPFETPPRPPGKEQLLLSSLNLDSRTRVAR